MHVLGARGRSPCRVSVRIGRVQAAICRRLFFRADDHAGPRGCCDPVTDTIHGTPITPNGLLAVLGRRNYCVSYYRPDQIEIVSEVSAIMMIDNGAFSAWKKGIVLDAEYWGRFYEFVRNWIRPGDWFVIPDVIDAGTQEQDALIRECPADIAPFGVPVWHMDEPIGRLLSLIEKHGRVCMGSTAEYAVVGSASWRMRMDEAWDAIAATFGDIPWIHMLRGMQCLMPSFDYPFSSVDSTDLARNHNRLKRYGDDYLWAIKAKADRWDSLNCPTSWEPRRELWNELYS